MARPKRRGLPLDPPDPPCELPRGPPLAGALPLLRPDRRRGRRDPPADPPRRGHHHRLRRLHPHRPRRGPDDDPGAPVSRRTVIPAEWFTGRGMPLYGRVLEATDGGDDAG